MGMTVSAETQAAKRRIALVIGAVCAACGLHGGPASAQLRDAWDETFSGVRHLHRTGTDSLGVQQNYHIALVDLSDPAVTIRVAINNDTWTGAKEPVDGMAIRHGAVLAVNGDYWSWGRNDPSQGTTAIDGTCYRAHPERSAFAFDGPRSRVEIGAYGTWPIPDGPPDDCPEWIAGAIGGGPPFMFDGVARWDESANPVDTRNVDINGDTFFGPEGWAWDTGRQPNTALGISADGRTLILLTCDGRGAGGAGGCRMASDVVSLMEEFGADDALKLDSGGSTTFFYDGAIRNVPSDGRPRAVADALLVLSARVDAGGCDAVLDGTSAVTIDDSSRCFTRSGDAWWVVASGEGGSAWWTWTVDGAAESVGTWRAQVGQSGRYRVEVFVPDAETLSSQALYVIETGTSEASQVVDQAGSRGAWAVVGEYDVIEGDELAVVLADNTGERFKGVTSPSSRRVIFDAVRFTPLASGETDAGSTPADSGGSRPSDGGSTPAADGGSGSASLSGCACHPAVRGRSTGWVLSFFGFVALLILVGRVPRR